MAGPQDIRRLGFTYAGMASRGLGAAASACRMHSQRGLSVRFSHLHLLEVQDGHGRSASARGSSVHYIDYLHLGKFEESWLIVSALWEDLADAVAADA